MLTKDERKAAAMAPHLGDRWGKLDSMGPAMAVAQMRGATFYVGTDGWCGAANGFSMGLLFGAADELAQACGYGGEQDMMSAMMKTPDDVRSRLRKLAGLKHGPKIKPKHCAHCGRRYGE